MSLIFNQLKKDMFTAEFQVIHNDNCIGQLSFKGRLGSRDGEWGGVVMGHNIYLRRDSHFDGYRPYRIVVDGCDVGYVSQIDVKKGLFVIYQYHQICYSGQTYKLYGINLGKKGGTSSLYCDDNQLAEINKDATVYNELHSYEIFALDENNAFICILLCCYMYMLGCYRPGEKVTSSFHTSVTITTNKYLKEKYNPDFKSTHSFF